LTDLPYPPFRGHILGEFLTTQAYWSSPEHDFVDLLIGIKNKYDPCDLFKFAQSIPLRSAS
jgi:hypothetical protein